MALSNPEDNFHNSSLAFVRDLQIHAISTSIGPPFLLEVGKAAEAKGAQAALRLVSTIEEYGIELTRTLDDQLWSLSSEYASLGVLGSKRIFDLLHYASATLSGCTHLASWDRRHFNDRIEQRVNRVNASKGLTSLKVGDPFTVVRHLRIE